jgi:hypothetical protein
LDDIVEDDEVQVVPPSPSGVRALGDDVEDEIVATNNGLSLEMEDTMLAALKHWRTVETGTRWGFNGSERYISMPPTDTLPCRSLPSVG